ncbi:spore protease YyaC [Lentibacillus cibarius]|uniref:Spore protease YyaC n=1 Tax=Lentibacillus cibarius TaxID=2583219 RepID=A0A5S3QK80_9BACI|nr:spore protease YyaC [Lentibacillus cibarius]TMN22265.1 spore protease YyaC [Lentibacillus cibarius]
MNLINRFIPKNDKLQLMYDDPDLLDDMTQRIISWLPENASELVVVCIGTDRSTGDALGPFTGSFLAELKPKYIHLYGTLDAPIHAANMEESIRSIRMRHQNPYVIAIDASLGKPASVGTITVDTGSLKPGAALNKKLPAIGDIHITGVVNIGGFMEFSILQNTRLSLVVSMAKRIAAFLYQMDEQLVQQHATAHKENKKMI